MKHTECKDCELSKGDCGYHFKMDGITNYEIASLSACDKYGNCMFFKAKAKAQGKWIAVSERLPMRNGVYNVTRKLKEGETIYFISDASYFDGQNTWHRDICVNHGKPYLTDIIAWQPLPKPYKEGGAE